MRITFQKIVAIFWLLALSPLVWFPQAALACAVCGAFVQEATRKAFIGTTAFMTFLPLGMLFLLVGWFIRRTLQREEEEAQEALAEQRERPLHSTR